MLRGALSESQERGVVKLQRRVKEGEVVLRTTDKSKKMCVCTYESYVRGGDKGNPEQGEYDSKELS